MFKSRNGTHNGAKDSLDQSLQDLAAGRLTEDELLARLPVLEEEERQQVEAAAWFSRSRAALDPRPGFVSASRRRLVAQLQVPQSQPAPGLKTAVQPKPRLSTRLLQNKFSRVVLALLMVVVLIANTNSMSAAAKSSFPGDMFYPVKIVSEEVELAFTFDPAQDATLYTRFAQRRLADQAALILEGRLEQLPGTAENAAAQIDTAVGLIQQIAETDPQKARILGLALDEMVFEQTEVLQLLSTAIPEGYVWTIEIVVQAAQDGRDALAELLD